MSQIGGDEEAWWLNETWYRGLNPGRAKDNISGKIGEIQMRSGV